MTTTLTHVATIAKEIAQDYELDTYNYESSTIEGVVTEITFEGPNGNMIFGSVYPWEIQENDNVRIALLGKFIKWSKEFSITRKTQDYWALDMQETRVNRAKHLRHLEEDKQFFDTFSTWAMREIELTQ